MNTERFFIVKSAFMALLPSLAEYICSTLRNNDNKNWWKRYVIDNLHESIIRDLPKEGTYEECKNNLDIQACLNIIEKNWYIIFQHKMNKNLRTWAHELKDIRNDVEAHYTTHKMITFDDEDVDRALDTMARFMISINKEVGDEIRHIKNNLKKENKQNDKQYRNNKLNQNKYDIKQERKKIERKIDGWFIHKDQYNSIILYAFLNLYELNNGNVTYDELREKTKLKDKFKGNFDQMKNFGAKNHGKIFEQTGNNIYFWNEVKELILAKYRRYKK